MTPRQQAVQQKKTILAPLHLAWHERQEPFLWAFSELSHLGVSTLTWKQTYPAPRSCAKCLRSGVHVRVRVLLLPIGRIPFKGPFALLQQVGSTD